jgi:predicted nucleic acid-binding protein
VLVVDASALASALVGDDAPGQRARAELADEPLYAPELIDIEVASAWRRHMLAGQLDGRRAESALSLLAEMELIRAPHTPLMPRIWELRDNVTPYDAAYVALAEALGAPLVTADARLAGAPGPRCEFRIVR